MVRLRWTKVANEVVGGPVIAGKDKYIVIISLPKFKVYVYSKKKELEFEATSLRAAKILAKKELIKLGARFYDEVRHGHDTT